MRVAANYLYDNLFILTIPKFSLKISKIRFQLISGKDIVPDSQI